MKQVIQSDKVPRSPKPQSQAVVTDHFVFLSGVLATDYASGVAPDAALNADVAYCGEPEMVRQADYLLHCMGSVLETAGAGFDNLLRIEQFMIGKEHAPWYPVSRRAVMDPQHPTSTRVCAEALEVPGALIVCDAIAANPASGWQKASHDLDVVPKSITGYPAAISYGPFVFVPGMVATDFKTGIAPAARADPNFWIHSPIKLQTEHVLETMAELYEALGMSLGDVVQASVYLTDMNDLPGMEHVWRQFFPESPPARTIFSSDVRGITGGRIEISTIAARSDDEVPRSNIVVDSIPAPLFHEPHAVKVGPYLFISGQMAVDDAGLVPAARVNPGLPWYSSPIKEEVRQVLKNVAVICEAAGGSLADVVRSQCVFRDLRDLWPAFEVWGETFSTAPPTNVSAQVKGPMPVPGCRSLWSLVAYIP